MAELATVNFLNALKSETSKREFAEFLGLPVGTTLCFVVDTTGSMSEEIAAVRDTAIRLTRQGSESTMRPSDYLLAPFNDPGKQRFSCNTSRSCCYLIARQYFASYLLT